jgi:hypothetical protein
LTNRVSAIDAQGGTQYVCTGWTMTGNEPVAGSSNVVEITLTNDATLVWTWLTNYWLQTAAQGGGSVAPVAGWQPASPGIPLTASADPHHHFVNWTGDTNAITSGSATATSIVVRLAGAVSLTANFTIDRHTLTVASEHGAAEPAVGLHSNDYGASVECRMSSVETVGGTQYVCTGWALTGQSDTNGLTAGGTTGLVLVVTNDAVLTWKWATNYWLHVAAGANGSVTPPDAWHTDGAPVQIVAAADAHYHFAGWSGSGTNSIVAGSVNAATVTVAMTSAVDLLGSFAIDRHTLVIDSPHGPAVPPSGPHTSDYGTMLTNSVAATDTQGTTQYICTGWTLTGQTDERGLASGSDTRVVLQLTTDAVLTWTWRTNFWLEGVADGAGQVRPPNRWYAAGDEAVCFAQAGLHRHFAGWSGDTNGCDQFLDVIFVPMDQGRRIVARFEIDRYNLDIVSTHGTAEPAAGRWTNGYGASVECRVSGEETVGTTQYLCTGWTLSGQSDTNGATSGTETNVALVQTSNAILTWGWRTNYWLHTAAGSNGSVAPADAWYAAGSNVPVAATADAHYHFAGWSGSGTNRIVTGDANAPTVTVAMTGPVDLVATFELDRRGLIIISQHGAAEPAAGVYTNDYGASVECRVSSEETAGTTQYVSTGWTLSGQSDTNGAVAGPGTNVALVVTNDATLTWTWATNYWLHTVAGVHGSVTPGDAWQGAGATVAITAAPDPHCHFVGWSGDGTNRIVAGDVNAGTVTVAMTGPVDIRAAFSLDAKALLILSQHGAAEPAAGLYTNDYGSRVECRVSGVETLGTTQYVSAGWTLTGQSDTNGVVAGTGTNVALVVTNDATLTWTWATNYWLHTAAGAHGNVMPDSGWHADGSNVPVVAAADQYYHFAGWTGDGTNRIVAGDMNSATVTVAMTAAADLTGWFGANTTARGTPEWWLAGYGLTNGWDAEENGDPDGDRLLTWEEWVAGTDPTRSGSVLALTRASQIGAAGAEVSWWSVSNKTYAIERGTNLLAPDFTAIATNLPATPPINVYTDSAAAPAGGVFYRISVER